MPAYSLALTVLMGASACGGAKANDDEAWVPPPTMTVERTFLEDGRYEEQLDIDLDGNVDTVIRYTLFGDDGRPVEDRAIAMRTSLESRRQVEKEIDINGDGTMDTFRYYSLSGELEREERDADFDGAVEYVATYSDGTLLEVQLDENVDGIAETVRYYRDGELFRVESDETGNGVTDHYYYYADGVLERLGVDQDENGAIDEWIRRPIASTMPTPGLRGAGLEGSGEGPDEDGDLDDDAGE